MFGVFSNGNLVQAFFEKEDAIETCQGIVGEYDKDIPKNWDGSKFIYDSWYSKEDYSESYVEIKQGVYTQ